MYFKKLTLLTLISAVAQVLGTRHEGRYEAPCSCSQSSDLNLTGTSATSSSTTSASDFPGGGECSVGSPCHGDITFYEAGLGACGITNDGSTEHIVALAHEFMGTQSNGNPFCGKSITISYGGITVLATVQDKCMGCVRRDIDVSNAAFNALGIAESVGRTTADWWFN